MSIKLKANSDGTSELLNNADLVLKFNSDNYPYDKDGNRLGISELSDSDGAGQIGFLQGGTGASTRTVQAKLRDFVSVKDFGAVGDGVTDDAAAIQAAFDSVSDGASVFFPSGIYVISADDVGVDVNGKNGLSIFGNNATILTPELASTARPFVVRNSDGLDVSGITFKCDIPHGPTTQPCNGLDLMNVTNARIKNCTFIGQTFYGLGAYQDVIGDTSASCAGLSVDGCKFLNIGSIGIEAFPKVKDGDFIVSCCVFENCGNNVVGSGNGCAIKTGQGFDNAVVSGCTFLNCGNATCAVAVPYYSKCSIVGNNFFLCNNINIAVSILEPSLGENGSYECLVISNNVFSCDKTNTTNNGLIELSTDSSGMSIYDASKGSITISNNTINNTSTTVAFAKIRPSNSVSRFVFSGNIGNELGFPMIFHDDSRGGVLVDAVVSKNTIRMSDASSSVAIYFLKGVGGSFVDNEIYNASQYALQAGQHTSAQLISGNKFFKCNRSATASRGPILLGTHTDYVPADVYVYGNVVMSSDYAALVLASAAYNIYNANNVMPKIATTSTPVEIAEATFGAYTTNADSAVNGYITIKDHLGSTRKLATIA